MKRQYVQPTVAQEKRGCDDTDVYSHNAFGTITLTTRSGGIGTLFGSDIKHHQSVCISIQRAKLGRDLSHDWVHGEIMPLIEVELSHAQFAQFITSNGNGGGTPVTLLYAPEEGANIAQMNGIEQIRTKHELHYKEISDLAKKSVDKIQLQIDELGALIESGKVGKKALQGIHEKIKWAANAIQPNMEFVVKSAEEALETATAHAKIEVEAYVTATAQKLGFETIEQFARLENKGEK